MISCNIVDKTFLLLIGVLLFVLVNLMASQVGPLGPAELYGFGRTLLLAEGLMAIYLVVNLKRLSNIPDLVVIILVWMLWVLSTNINFIFPLELALLYKGLLEPLLWTFFCLFFYVYIKKNPSGHKAILCLFFGLLLFASYEYFKIYSMSQVFADKTAAINFTYYPLLILPWVLMAKFRLIRYLGILLIGIVVLSSLKRTAFICFIVSVVMSELINAHFMNKKMRSFLVVFALCVPVIVYLLYFNTGAVDLHVLTRFSEAVDDRGSGRLDVYSEVIRLLMNSEWENMLRGHGHNTVIVYSNMNLSAHNDWLEVVFDYGLPGFLLYGTIHAILIKKILYLYNNMSIMTGPFAASYVMFWVMSLTSHLIIYPTYFVFMSSFWGMIFASTVHINEYERNC